MADKIEFDMTAMASEMMLKLLDQGKRDLLIKDAIAHLIEPTPPAQFSSRQGPSKLQQCFYDAISREVHDMVAVEVANNPDIKKQLGEAVSAGFAKFFDSAKLPDLISNRLWGLFEENQR